MTNNHQTADEADHDDKVRLDRTDTSQDFVDQSKLDFDPDDGLYSGTAVDGNSEIPGPHFDADTGEMTGMDEARQEYREQQERQEQ